MSELMGIDGLLARLKSHKPDVRDVAAAEITDLIEADQLDKNKLKKVVRALLDEALAEKDPITKESMFNALSSASIAPISEDIEWNSIASSLTTLEADCLEHALIILGNSGNNKYRTAIERYTKHPDETIRLTATDALSQFDSAKRPRLKSQRGADKCT